MCASGHGSSILGSGYTAVLGKKDYDLAHEPQAIFTTIILGSSHDSSFERKFREKSRLDESGRSAIC